MWILWVISLKDTYRSITWNWWQLNSLGGYGSARTAYDTFDHVIILYVNTAIWINTTSSHVDRSLFIWLNEWLGCRRVGGTDELHKPVRLIHGFFLVKTLRRCIVECTWQRRKTAWLRRRVSLDVVLLKTATITKFRIFIIITNIGRNDSLTWASASTINCRSTVLRNVNG